MYWRSGILQPSECLSLASSGDLFDRLGGGPLKATVGDLVSVWVLTRRQRASTVLARTPVHQIKIPQSTDEHN